MTVIQYDTQAEFSSSHRATLVKFCHISAPLEIELKDAMKRNIYYRDNQF